jgi:hypothetical protein
MIKIGEFYKTTAGGIVYINDVDDDAVSITIIKTNNAKYYPGYKGTFNTKILDCKLDMDGHPDDYLSLKIGNND